MCHGKAFFLLDPHSIDQNGRYRSNGVSSNKICNNSLFQLDGVNISVADISDDISYVSANKNKVRSKLLEIAM
uniref:Peptidase C76 domain-containing protein n=1 Tax=Strongyloides venezuelensis TaxID=75913 RepID=A0A0K0G5Z2_STRVS